MSTRDGSAVQALQQGFRSRAELALRTVTLRVPQARLFGPYSFLMHPEAPTHPARANVYLLERLVEGLTAGGETVLDPMAGTGSTGVVAAMMGRDAVVMDIEPRYHQFMQHAARRVEALGLSWTGEVHVVLGDARRAHELLAEMGLPRPDTIITSPPYPGVKLAAGDPARRLERLLRAGHDPKRYLSRFRAAVRGDYPMSPDNIARLRGESYWDAMRQVYASARELVRPGGSIAVIVRARVRGGAIVDVPELTRLALIDAGWRPFLCLRVPLSSPSIWHHIRRRRSPGYPVVDAEHVIVARA
ncbi:MAG: DNA methyltransferase [Nitrososphaerota archaeon]